jgi:tetratricopeptide (TPR) repeat protein
MALALCGAGRAEADAYLGKQSALADIQRHHLDDHLSEQFKQLRLATWEKRLGVLLRVATAAVGLAVAGGLALMIWSASHSHAMIVEPFSVPPDLVAQGDTGEVIAAKLLDDVSVISAEGVIAATATFANGGDQRDLKVEIPETGVSLSELYRFLEDRLGDDTRVTGEIVRTASGLTLTVRAGPLGAESVSGPETQLDALLQSLALAFFKRAQPLRYGNYLVTHGRRDEAVDFYRARAKSGAPRDRAQIYMGWANATADSEAFGAHQPLLEQAYALDPDNPLLMSGFAAIDTARGRSEQALQYQRKGSALLYGAGRWAIRDDNLAATRTRVQGYISLYTGAYHDAATATANLIKSGAAMPITSPSATLAAAQAGEHDLAAARKTLADPDLGNGIEPGMASLTDMRTKLSIDRQREDWAGMLARESAIASLAAQYPGLRSYLPTVTAPLLAYAQARLGNLGAAEVQIAGTAPDCYPCLIARAQIADLQGQRARADWWFGRAAEAAPSIPFAYEAWGRALLGRGDAAGAIAKFKTAGDKGPHFADPLEGWGEALMAENRSDLAAAKFSQAAQYAPNWGRLHLKWGEAHFYAGKKAEAQKQFALAAALDLTPSEKSELARMGK